ncbi:ankyrin repeat domain-containing protein, partial [Tessaracoccus lubricantis]
SPSATTSAAPSASPSPAAPATPQEELDQLLRDAAWANDVAKARELVLQGADVNAKDSTQQSAYLVATSEGYGDLLDLTLVNGALIDDKDSWNGTGLIRAAERGHWLVVGKLLEAGIDRDHVNRIGYQAIHESIWLGEDTPDYVTTVRVLAAGGVQLDRPSGQQGLTPLQKVEQRGHAGQEAALTAALNGQSPADP